MGAAVSHAWLTGSWKLPATNASVILGNPPPSYWKGALSPSGTKRVKVTLLVAASTMPPNRSYIRVTSWRSAGDRRSLSQNERGSRVIWGGEWLWGAEADAPMPAAVAPPRPLHYTSPSRAC